MVKIKSDKIFLEKIAKAALYLSLDDTTYITGINLMVDGGWMAG
jgi:NAD(P)-dependent dehydrogenase (short-subunit alcohol dehydrogenase family)